MRLKNTPKILEIMPPSDALFELIKSLEQAEKRHFKIFAKRHVMENGNQYLLLFDIMDRLSDYDETLIKRKLGNTLFAKNLSSSKNYLYSLLLQSLRNYNSGRSVRAALHELWLDIDTLTEKGLLKQASKLLHKAKKLAIEYHYDIPHLELMIMDRKLIRRYISKHADQILKERQQETETLLNNISYRLKMLDLYEAFFLNHRNRNDAKEPLTEMLKAAENLTAQEDQVQSFEVLLYYHMLFFNYANVEKNHEKAIHHLGALIELYEKNYQRIDEDQENYISILNNYLNKCFEMNRLEEFPPLLQKMRAMNAKTFKIRALIFQNANYLEILYHLAQQHYKEVIALVSKIEKGLKTYASNITKSRQLTFYYNIAIAYFLEKKYTEALEWINRILNEPKQEERQDIQALARIFQLVIHFELDNYDFVDSLILSAKSYLIKKDKRNSAEFLIVKYLKEALYVQSKKQREVFTRLAEELREEKGLEEIKIWVGMRSGELEKR